MPTNRTRRKPEEDLLFSEHQGTSFTISRTSAIKARLRALKAFWTSETVVFYLQVAVFFSLVFILPMIPMLMFIFTENSPSINPDVLKDLLKNAKGKSMPTGPAEDQLK